MLPTKSFCKAIAVVANNGKAWGENWSPEAQYIEKVTNEDGVFLRFVKNTKSGVEKIGWSPSLADPYMGWKYEGEVGKDTFGYALLQLIEENVSIIRHKNWSDKMGITVGEFTIETKHDEEIYENGILVITDTEKIENKLMLILPNGLTTEYFPTVPDILRKGWVLE